MEESDISYMHGNIKFNYRVASLIEYKGKVLLHKPKDCGFWNLVGGRVKYGESTLEAIKRELKEELDFDISSKKTKPILFAENFFVYEGVQSHENLFVYYIKANKLDEITKNDEFTTAEKENVVFKWFAKKDVKNIVCKPVIIYEMVKWKNKKFRQNFELLEK